MKTIGAQIVFVESDAGHRWTGRLLNARACIDSAHGKPVTGRPRFDIVEGANGSFVVTMQGGHRGGRRYTSYPSLTEAQVAGIRWAARRFRIEVPS